MKPNETGWKPGIVKLKDTALSQARIERLGPPPGNAEVLIRGGAGWVFGVAPREEPSFPLVATGEEVPTQDEVMVALAREMAWRWYSGRAPFVSAPNRKEPGVSRKAEHFVRYTDAEHGFLTQAMGLVPKRTTVTVDAGALLAQTTKTDCVCIQGTTCCAGVCQSCKEG
jgi:hypothetical protein